MNRTNWPATIAKLILGLPWLIVVSAFLALISAFAPGDANEDLDNIWSVVRRRK